MPLIASLFCLANEVHPSELYMLQVKDTIGYFVLSNQILYLLRGNILMSSFIIHSIVRQDEILPRELFGSRPIRHKRTN